MRAAGALGSALLVWSLAGHAGASAWNQADKHGQFILKFEQMEAMQAYEQDGSQAGLPAPRNDRGLSGLLEYGLMPALTVRMKAQWQAGDDAFVDYSGRGPLEIGVAWQAYRDDYSALAVYAGMAAGGEGRNAGYALPGEGDRDWELRLLAGRSFSRGKWLPGGAFVDAQMAHLWREGLSDEVRADVTAGVHFGRGWTAMTQAFAGRTTDGGAKWLSVETSVVRQLGRWSLQGGWRRTVAGANTPLAQGVVIAIWRRF